MKRYKSNKYHIPLQNLPITVGKMAGAVDLVLNDQSVSRLHARISRDGNRFFITDLNSTNGTFRNGMWLEPNASEIIEPSQTPFLPGYCGWEVFCCVPLMHFSGIVQGYSRYADGTVCRNALHYYNHIARKCRGWSIRCTLINPVHGADVLRWHCPCRRSQIGGDRESEDDWDLYLMGAWTPEHR